MKFVWSEKEHFIAGAGGTENHTLERARELKRRGKDVEIILLSDTHYDPGFSDINYRFVSSATDLASIEDTIIYIARGHDISTLKQSYLFLHFPITHPSDEQTLSFKNAALRSKLITNSRHAQNYWANVFDVPTDTISVVYPFAHPIFSTVKRIKPSVACRVIYPNRIAPEKGLFIFLEAAYILNDASNYKFTILGAGNKTPKGKQTEKWLKNIPYIQYLQPSIDREEMAHHYANSDIVVVPSRNDYWQEPFGMTSVEGQHAGCRVIASNSGGLTETDCGLLNLVEAGDAHKLVESIKNVSMLTPVSVQTRRSAAKYFTLKQSVDSFLTATRQAL